jgi:YD repeat-containing protein
VIDARGHSTKWERDLQGRITKEIRPDGAETTYTYENTTSQLKRRTDAKGQHTDYSYFLDGRLREVSYPNADPATPTVTLAHDPRYSRLLSMQDGTGTTTYTYNPITEPPQLGAGELASVDGPLQDDTITYGLTNSAASARLSTA